MVGLEGADLNEVGADALVDVYGEEVAPGLRVGDVPAEVDVACDVEGLLETGGVAEDESVGLEIEVRVLGAERQWVQYDGGEQRGECRRGPQEEAQGKERDESMTDGLTVRVCRRVSRAMRRWAWRAGGVPSAACRWL